MNIELFKGEYPDKIFILIDEKKYKRLKKKFEKRVLWET